MEYGKIKIRWLGHDSFIISNSKVIMIDPYRLKKRYKTDLLLITHEHFDHLSEDDIKKVIDSNTSIIAPKQCEAELKKIRCKEVIIVKPRDKINVQGVDIEAIAAYNTNKINPATNKPYHPKDDEKVGYVFTLDNVRIYHAGDTDAIEEMKGVKTDIALLPVSGTYVMTPEEAVEAVKMIKPKLIIPMHYGAIVGSKDDAVKFKRLVGEYNVNILDIEP
ncbi:MAG: MBL fold metallo-hydrolase [Candidatus Nitrosocaldaceae archaeon]